MRLFWVSAIVNDKEDKKPCLIAINTGDLTLEAAHKNVEFIKNNHNVLSVWIDTFDENNKKETVFHECFINAFGDKVK